MRRLARRCNPHPTVGEQRRAAAPEDGSVSLESTLIVLGVITPLFLGAANVAVMGHAQNLAESAAQAGVTAARTYENPQDGVAAARAYIQQVSPGVYTSVDVTGGRGADTVTITVHGTTRGFMGLPLPPVDAIASAPVERITE